MLKSAGSNFRTARTQIGYARSNEAPTISVGPGAGTVRDSANQPYFPSNLANNGLGNYEIDLWRRVRRGETSAREQAQASDADMETARLSGFPVQKIGHASLSTQLVRHNVRARRNAGAGVRRISQPCTIASLGKSPLARCCV